MKYTLHEMKGKRITEIHQLDAVLKEPGDFLDMIANAPSKWILLHKHNVAEEFFDLKTRVAGEILQKAANYNIRFGIIGDFSGYESKSLKDFMYESNKGRQIVFAEDVEAGKALFG